MRRSSARTPADRAPRLGPAGGGRFAWLAFGVGVLVLVTPLRLAWARSVLGWTFPFFLWLGLIVLGAALGYGQDDGGEDDEDSA